MIRTVMFRFEFYYSDRRVEDDVARYKSRARGNSRKSSQLSER